MSDSILRHDASKHHPSSSCRNHCSTSPSIMLHCQSYAHAKAPPLITSPYIISHQQGYQFRALFHSVRIVVRTVGHTKTTTTDRPTIAGGQKHADRHMTAVRKNNSTQTFIIFSFSRPIPGLPPNTQCGNKPGSDT